jgi:alpha-L-fucosidase
VNDTKTHGFTANDFRFTTKGGAVYAIQMAWPAERTALIHGMGSDGLEGKRIQSIALLGSEAQLRFEQQAQGLRIKLPDQPPSKYACAFRIQLG